LQTVFAEAGEIVEVFLPLDRNTGRPRGFAFIQFGDDLAAAEAIRKYDGYELKGRKIRVSEAEERRRAPSAPSFNDEGSGGKAPYNSGRVNKPKGSRKNLRGRKRSL
jgi:RNA recognition motif-containing protein